MLVKIDEYLPKYDWSEKHKILIKCSAKKTYEALFVLNFSDSIIIRLLFWLRGLNSGNFNHFRENFTLLYNEPNSEIILGLIARPWRWNGGIVKVSANDFQNFNENGYVKMVWNFIFKTQNEVETLVTTETRILATSAESKNKFRLYWFFVHPFSGIIRIEMLRLLKKKLETV